MASNEDCASVLEQFIHDAANLPAEITHMMEEIQAKDKDLQKHLSVVNQKDSNIQKHLKTNGVLAPHPKENEYADLVKKNFDLCLALQDQKIALSEKACMLLERQVKKLDVKIRELQNDGQLQDGPPLPSVFNRKAEAQKPFLELPTNIPLQNASVSALNANAHRANAQTAATMQQPQPRTLPQITTVSAPAQRSSAPATPASAVQQQRQREREHSLGAENKRRKLGNPLAGANLPAQPSGLRQSSLGPGTPKAGTPTGTGTSRAGSIPRTTGAQQAAAPPKKSGLPKKVISHQQVNKLKQKAANKGRLSVGRKKGQSPSVRGGRGGTAASEDADSALSSADASETDASQSRRGRGNKKQQPPVAEDADAEAGEDEEMDDDDGEDDKVYCFCHQRSYGEMVACENEDCPYQWFHTGCLNMKKVPDEDEDWYCPHCREKPAIIEKVQRKMQTGTK
jgi:inhibitor of growth protein 3